MAINEEGYLVDEIDIIENTKESIAGYRNKGWGQSEYVLSKEHIQALIDGKAIAVADGEYTNVFVLEGETK